MAYCYFLVKICDLFDTVFFVLRKRTRQISFLHVYHHVAIMMGAYIAVAWAPGNFPIVFGPIGFILLLFKNISNGMNYFIGHFFRWSTVVIWLH